MNNFNKLLKEFKELNLPIEEYAIYGSGPLAVRGVRETDDLDVLITDSLYQKLKVDYPNSAKEGKLTKGKIDMYPSWNWMWGDNVGDLKDAITRAEIIDGVKFITLQDLIDCKRKMAREKDFEDIRLIEEYLKKDSN